MTEEKKLLDWHKKLAVECFNNTWKVIDKKERDKNDEILMIHLAHASRFHWGVLVDNN